MSMWFHSTEKVPFGNIIWSKQQLKKTFSIFLLNGWLRSEAQQVRVYRSRGRKPFFFLKKSAKPKIVLQLAVSMEWPSDRKQAFWDFSIGLIFPTSKLHFLFFLIVYDYNTHWRLIILKIIFSSPLVKISVFLLSI